MDDLIVRTIVRLGVSCINKRSIMISLKRTFLLLALFAVAFGQNDGPTDSHIKPKIIVYEINLNKAFDAGLPNIRHYITNNGFDPMDVPDVEIPLSPLPGLLKTKMILHHGHLQELSTIYRTGDIILQYSEEKLSLYLNIGFKTLDLSHEYSLRWMLYNRKGDCYGRYHDVTASMLVDYDRKSHKINLKFFKFVDVGDFKVRLEGHFADQIINIITETLSNVFRTQILRIIELKAYEEIDKRIQEINEIITSFKNLEIVVKEVIEGQEFDDIPTYKFNRTELI